jgi:hypothetical protein
MPDWRLPIADCQLARSERSQSEIRNRQSAICLAY